MHHFHSIAWLLLLSWGILFLFDLLYYTHSLVHKEQKQPHTGLNKTYCFNCGRIFGSSVHHRIYIIVQNFRRIAKILKCLLSMTQLIILYAFSCCCPNSTSSLPRAPAPGLSFQLIGKRFISLYLQTQRCKKNALWIYLRQLMFSHSVVAVNIGVIKNN